MGRLLELGSLPANKTDETLLRLQTLVDNNEPGNIHKPASISSVRGVSVSPDGLLDGEGGEKEKIQESLLAQRGVP